jgi:MFS family permease
MAMKRLTLVQKGREKMKMTNKTPERKVILSTLWIFATLNYLYCDVVGLMDPDLLGQYLIGSVNGIHMTQGFLLGAGILVEIPIALVLLSRVLRYRANRWANIAAGSVMTAVQCLTLVLTPPRAYYVFFSILEIGCTALIIWYSWRWPHPERGVLPGADSGLLNARQSEQQEAKRQDARGEEAQVAG